MKRTLIPAVIVPALALAGCGSAPQAAPPTLASGDVALAALAPAGPTEFYFGAGDRLGHELFVYYVATLRLEEQSERYATGENDFIE